MNKMHPPIHPSEILFEEFMKPNGISQYEVAKVIGVSPRRINEIVHGKRAITVDTGLRLARACNMNDSFFTGLQAAYDLEFEQDRLAPELATIKVLAAVAAASP